MSSQKINLLIHGFGRMGELVKKNSLTQEVEVLSTVDPHSPNVDVTKIEDAELGGVDAIIDFSNGSGVLNMVKTVLEKNPNIRIVVATSAWDNDKEEVKKIVEENNLYFMYGANFSIGTNLFIKMVKTACELFNKFPDYDASLLDIHHRHKADMPSGTAKKIAQDMVDRLDHKDKILYGMEDRAIEPGELHVNCLRLGENKGMHEVIFDSAEEVIKISGQTRDRGAFAKGAIQGMKWMMDQEKPGYYTFDECLEDILQKK